MKNFILILSLLTLLGFTVGSQAEIVYIHNDALGSPIMETNELGAVISRSHYKPFGETLEPMKEGVGYTGHLNDTDLELTYMQARYYDPVIGRFMSNDPVGFHDIHSFNRYAYANNNPYKYVDPTGTIVVLLRPSIRPIVIPKTVSKVSPVTQAVRTGIKQSVPNKAAQQMQKNTNNIKSSMNETVKNSKPEVRKSTLNETPKSPSDTKVGMLNRLGRTIMEALKDGDLFGSQAAVTPGSSDSGISKEAAIVALKIEALLPAPPPEVPNEKI